MVTAKDEWTEAKCIQLIREYRARPVLWDAKGELFFKRSLKPEAWEEIGQALNTPADECKHKMIVIMSSFRREKAKILNSMKRDSSKMYKSSWFAIKELAFLMDKGNERRRQRKVLDINYGDNGSLEETILKNHLKSTDTMKKRLLANKIFADANSSIRPEMTPGPSCSKSEEEIASFTNFIATKMRKYTETTKNEVQKAICEVIFKADQNFYDNPNSSSSFSPGTNESHDFVTNVLIENDIECETIVIKEEYSDTEEMMSDSI